VASVVLVSQAEHVIRAVFTCRELGVRAVGLVAPAFDGTAFWLYRAHEVAALPLAWWEVYVRSR
jgi:vancomycin permeability regulator SanA